MNFFIEHVLMISMTFSQTSQGSFPTFILPLKNARYDFILFIHQKICTYHQFVSGTKNTFSSTLTAS